MGAMSGRLIAGHYYLTHLSAAGPLVPLLPVLSQLVRELHLIDHGEGLKFGVFVNQCCIMHKGRGYGCLYLQ